MDKRLKAETFLVETVQNNKFVKMGKIIVLLQELYRELEGSKRIFGLHTLARKKIRNQYQYRDLNRIIGNRPIVLTHLKYHFCKSKQEWKRILEDRCSRCDQPISGPAHISPRPDLCMSCYLDFRGD